MIPSRVFFVTRKRLTSTWQCTTFVFPPRLKWSGVRLRRTSRCRLLPAVYISTGFGVKLSLTPFVRDVLVRFKVPPSQLTLRPWRTVLGFEALRAAFAPDTYGVEEFCATHNVMTKTHQDARLSFLGVDATGRSSTWLVATMGGTTPSSASLVPGRLSKLRTVGAS